MICKATWLVTVGLFLPLPAMAQERERRNPDDIAPMEETYFNPDGTITRVQPLPDGRVKVNRHYRE